MGKQSDCELMLLFRNQRKEEQVAVCVKEGLLLGLYEGALRSGAFKVEINDLCFHKVCLPRLLVV